LDISGHKYIEQAEPGDPEVSRAPDQPISAICLNCQTLLMGPFCHQCGQKFISERLTLRAIVSDSFAQITKWDSSLLRTVKLMFRHPAEVSFAYLIGQRQQFVPPVRYLVFSVAVEFASTPILKWIALHIGNLGALTWLQQSGLSYSLRFLQVLVLASFWRVLFRKEGYNLAEIYAFGLYVFAQIILINVVINIAAVALPIPQLSRDTSIIALSLADYLFMLYAARGFFAKPWVSIMARLLISYSAPLILLSVWLRFVVK
jgi:hypothetical protein